MRTQAPVHFSGDASFAVIHACYTLTEQYRKILIDLGKDNDLSENEMTVLVHLALYPDVRTQKQLQATKLQLSVSSICRMVEALRKKGYLTTRLDENDRRSWIIHLEEKGTQLGEQFRRCLQQRLGRIFQGMDGFDLAGFAEAVSQAASLAQENAATA